MNDKNLNYESRDEIRRWCLGTTMKDTCLFVDKLRMEGVSDENIVVVLRVLDTTCRHCYDAGEWCQCWNDE